MWDIVIIFDEVRQMKLVVIWFYSNFLKTFGAHVACSSVVMLKFCPFYKLKRMGVGN